MISVDPLQDVEKARQLRSRIAQRLNVSNRIRLASSLAAASLDGLFDHPAGNDLIAQAIASPLS
jgi:hypothetical protein